ncbi:tyrosine-type recombinase/integrase [Nonomuraea wenchangensis]|uniref:tyrosine-type recombinase/integrase n=1 Tax=Nonomuraea wenchangensis TaxID=568860 RepID=UPI003316FB74
MSSSTKRRRSPGEGSVFSYKLSKGQVRYGIKFMATLPDGSAKQVLRRRDEHNQPWLTQTDAQKALREALGKVDKGEFVQASKQTLGAYLDEWVAGLRLESSTLASYKKNIRLHLKPYDLGKTPLAALTGPKLTAHYRRLEESGRKDHKAGEGLSARTVRYVHTILSAALSEAVDAGLLARNPADKAKPPTAKQAKAPEMHPWTTAQLKDFLTWSRDHSHLHVAWHLLAHTGMRRGELLALRWRHIDLEAGTISVRRSVGVVRIKGEGAVVKEGDTKTAKPRVVDLDTATVALLRAYKHERGGMALQLARDDALVFGDQEGNHRHPERFSRGFQDQLGRCARAFDKAGREALPRIRVHDLRHTHATILLMGGKPVKVVSERLGHADPAITLRVYAHVMPGNQREAADWFAALVESA